MQELIQLHDGPTFKPYGFCPEDGDCADAPLKDVSKESYAQELAFKLAGKLVVKHAP